MNVNVGVRTAAALLDQFYEKRRLLIVSAPTARNLLYRLQLGMLQVSPYGQPGPGAEGRGVELSQEGPSDFIKGQGQIQGLGYFPGPPGTGALGLPPFISGSGA